MAQEIKRYDEKKTEKELVVKTGKVKKKSIWQNKTFVTVGISLLIVFFGLASYLSFLGRPQSNKHEDFIYFEIKKGETKRQIADDLKKKKVIRSSLAFSLSAYFSKKGLQAGHYKISPAMKTQDILDKFQSGDVDAYTVTIPEGYRVLQIAKKLAEVGKIDGNKFLNSASGTEGTLFPDTYVIPYGLEESKIIKMFKDNFTKRTESLRVTEEQLILASIVEREAINDDERAKIAAVYKNRADRNMLMQADPTVRYGLDTQRYLKEKSFDFDFWQPLTRQGINELNSNFNTYKQKGYPPAPICNPGLKSIQAAIKPEENFDFLFFFHDKNQKIHFTKTYEEHLKAIQEFGV